MSITAAQVESNGWVLRLTLTAALSAPNTDFGGYNFDVNGTPRLTVATSHPGFVKSAGTAVPGVMTRAIVGLRPLRLPVNTASPLVKVIDETDLGGGSIQVRIALSETIYATDAGLTLATLAGWRTGEAAQSGITVTNSSTIAAPVPIMRWVLPTYESTTGTFRLSLIVISHHPVGFDPVAGVKFTVTDGTTVKTLWATALATDNSYGDNLRCYTVVVDPSVATALTAGLLRCDAEVYPYLGSVRTTDAAGTKSMTNIRTDGVKSAAEFPFVIGYDPAGTRYNAMFAYVDPVNGTTTPAAGMVQTTLALAKAVSAASRPATVSVAIQAGYLFNRTLAAANGQASQTRSVDGLRIVLAPGVHAGIGSQAATTGIGNPEIPVVIEGDPANTDPRANCIMRTGSMAAPNHRLGRVRVRNLRIETGGTAAMMGNIAQLYLDNVEITGIAGSEAGTLQPFSTSTTNATDWGWCVTRTKAWKTGFQFGGANRFVGLLRASQNSRRATATVILKNRHIPPAEDGFTTDSGTPAQGYGNLVSNINLGVSEDIVVAYNDIRSIRYYGLFLVPVSAALAGTSLLSFRRLAILNNVFERYTGAAAPASDQMFSLGEGITCEMTDIIIEGNTLAGERFNGFYGDPAPATAADTDTQNNIVTRVRLANNAFDRNASKQDDFYDSSVAALRAAAGRTGSAATGYRPVQLGAWSAHYGCGLEAHVDLGRAGSIADFRREGSGLRGIQFATPTAPGWADDRSQRGSNAGGGDYTPVAGSPFLGRVFRSNSDRDWAGNARITGGASGALEGPAAVPETGLIAAGARHAQSAGAGSIGLLLSAVPAGSTLQHSAYAPALSIQLTILPAASVLMTMGAATLMAVDGEVPLAPASAQLRFAAPPTLLLPDGSAAEDQTLKVRMDARMFFVTTTNQEI